MRSKTRERFQYLHQLGGYYTSHRTHVKACLGFAGDRQQKLF
ncbi:MAG: hypothetical protein RMX97_16025 [Nostoc sp. DedQUE11]|nr:hypothetical protein [Nostoc sp. DedQUE11]